ncbi:MAG: hypothetical protein IJM02_03185 [Clostridia bacterium]|nr:hypothetical protein [Clostridia bacterium]
MTHLPASMALSLILTIIIEGFTAFLLGVRGKDNFICVTLANIVTNPVVVCATFLASYYFGRSVRMPLEYALEIAAFVTEGIIYKKIPVQKKLNPFVFSLILNGVSYASGYILALFV